MSTNSRRLLTHLAQFSSFTQQGEVLCTRGLEYLLEHSGARSRMVELLGSSSERECHLDTEWVWRAEARQEDRARPDLEALSSDGRVRIKIEAKLGASLHAAQLQSYAAHFDNDGADGLLVILVPSKRVNEARGVVTRALLAEGWRCDVVVVSWEQVTTALGACKEEPFAGDLAQFAAMYAALADQLLTPINEAELEVGWRNEPSKFTRLVDLVTRDISPPDRLLPLAVEDLNGRDEYHRRYVCKGAGAGEPCFSVGIRDPFEDHQTPVWMRFHRSTAMFAAIRSRLTAQTVPCRVVASGGHLWMPIEILVDVPIEQVVKEAVAEVERIAAIAYLPPPDDAVGA
jgi:hypothetical protein